MSDLLSLGASGVRAYSRALQTVGDNIANAQTPGYARRSIVLAEPASGGSSPLYRTQLLPGGVRVDGVTRSTDTWLTEDARTSGADAGRASTRLGWLEATERALDDGGAGVGRAMTGFFNRADELAADPPSSARRAGFLQAIDDVATTFRRTADGLSQTASGIATEAGLAVGQLNTDVTALERVNEGLRRARDGSTNQASLLDERDRLLDTISAALPVTTAYDAKGAASLTLPDGATLLAGSNRATLAISAAPDGRLTLSGPLGTIGASSGSLSGRIDAADHVATQRAALDALAGTFATSVNAQHAAGRDAAGNPGAALLAPGTGAADIAAIALAASDVAAADAISVNGNALSFGDLRGSTGSEAAWSALAAQQSQVVAAARAQDGAASARFEGASNARDDLASVDLDREAGELLRFQQAYEASARVIQVAREIMQTILNAI
jgi:flagellar hook-associated protein 1